MNMPGNNKGFVALLPVLLIAAALVLVVTYGKVEPKENLALDTTSVLSEATVGSPDPDNLKTPQVEKTEEPKTDSSGTRTPETRFTEKPNSTSSSGRNEKFRTPKPTRSPLMTRSPKPSRSPEVTRSPKPLETPEEKVEELKEETEFEAEVTEGSRSAKIKIKQTTNSMHLEQETTSAKVGNDTPIFVNPETHELTVTTPAGEKSVTVLPDTAVEHVIKTGVVTEIQKDGTGRNDIKITTGPAGSAVYEMQGTKTEKLLGLVDVLIQKKTQVSLESGKVLKVDQTFLSKLLDLLSK